MHVLGVHRFPDATGVAFALTAWARHRCLQLYLLFFLLYIYIYIFIFFLPSQCAKVIISDCGIP